MPRTSESAIIERLGQIDDLPTIPQAISRVATAVNDPNTSATDVARILEDDPAITARVLRIVNSAFYSGLGKIDSLEQAVARIGLSSVHDIALATAVFSMFPNSQRALFNRTEFWRHSICTGITARVLIGFSKRSFPENAPDQHTLHLAGLLHDVGKIILEQHFHAEFSDALALAESKRLPLFEAETELHSCNHANVGACIARRWHLPAPFVHAIEFHHLPTQAPRESRYFAFLIHLANYTCNYLKIGDGGDLRNPVFDNTTWRDMQLDFSDVPKIMASVQQEAQKSEILLALCQEPDARRKASTGSRL